MIFLCRSTDRGVLVGAYTSSGTSYRRQRYVLRDVETTFLKNLILILPQMSLYSPGRLMYTEEVMALRCCVIRDSANPSREID